MIRIGSNLKPLVEYPEKERELWKSKVKASRIIKDTIEAGLIKPLDPDTAPRYMKYIPAWA